MAAAVFDHTDSFVVNPGFVDGGSVDVRCDVEGGGFAVGVDDPDVSAGGTLVGHEAADEGDALAVGRPAGDSDL